MIQLATKKQHAAGGAREGSGRRAADGARGLRSVSVGFSEEQIKFLDSQPGGRGVWLRKMVNAVAAQRRSKS